MSLAQSGVEQMIASFGEYVEVYSHAGQSPEDEDDPIYFSPNDDDEEYEEHKVRLYTSPSHEMLEDYGFDEDTECIMYSSEDIADNGDTVVYEPMDYEWVVEQTSTNQIGQGPYIFVYSMRGV